MSLVQSARFLMVFLLKASLSVFLSLSAFLSHTHNLQDSIIHGIVMKTNEIFTVWWKEHEPEG